MSGESPSGGSRVLLSITVEIEDGRVEQIELRPGDVPEEVSTRFCKQHDLPEQFIAPLTEHINHNLRSISNSSPSPSPRLKDENKRPPSASPQATPKGRSKASSRNDTNLDAINNSLSKNIRTPDRFSPRLLQPTYAFSVKTVNSARVSGVSGVSGSGSARRDRGRQKGKPELSEKMKAICLRLYSDYLRQRQRIEEEARLIDVEYKQRIQKEKPVLSQKSRKLMAAREKEARNFHNYGELLYQEGITRGQARKETIEKKKQEAELKQLEGVTLKPEISKFAKRLKRIEGVWERLIHDNKDQDHLQELRNELWEAKLMECTFRPRINYIQSFERRDCQTSSRFEQLFYDAEHRRRRQAEYMQWHPEGVTFQPHINKTILHTGAAAEAHVGEAAAESGSPATPAKGPEEKISVFDRLLHYAERITEKRQQIHENNLKLVDPVTGQELFHPATGRQPHFQRNASALPIGDFLYQMKFSLENKKQTTVERNQQEWIEQSRPQYVGPRSGQLLDHMKERRLKQIFDHLDSEKTGEADLSTADPSILTEEVVNELDIVKTMDICSGHPFRHNFDEFCNLMEEAQKKLGLNGLHAVFKYKEPEEKFPFKFQMCRHSKSLAQRRRQFNSRNEWYDIILMDRQHMLEKVDNLRKQRHEQEMAECTFSPAIVSRSKKPAEPLQRSAYAANPTTVVDKDKQEVHGFIFQDSPEAGGSMAPAGEQPANQGDTAGEAAVESETSESRKDTALEENVDVNVSS